MMVTSKHIGKSLSQKHLPPKEASENTCRQSDQKTLMSKTWWKLQHTIATVGAFSWVRHQSLKSRLSCLSWKWSHAGSHRDRIPGEMCGATCQIVQLYKNGYLHLKDRIRSKGEKKLRKTRVDRLNNRLDLGELVRRVRNWKGIAYGETKRTGLKPTVWKVFVNQDKQSWENRNISHRKMWFWVFTYTTELQGK